MEITKKYAACSIKKCSGITTTMAESETGIVSSKSYTRVLPAKMKTSALWIKHEHKCSCGKYFTII